MKRHLALFLAAVLLFALGGCGSTAAPSQAAQSTVSAAPAAQPADDGGAPAADGSKLKVALCMTGPKNDGSWNTLAYDAIVKAQQEYGIEVVYAENVQVTDMEAVYTDYAAQGCNLIIGHSFSFGDAALAVGAKYPDVAFVVIDGVVEADNVASYNLKTQENCFILGAIAASVSVSGKVGVVTSIEGPSIIKDAEAFKAGARYINPDIVALSAYTGSFDDVAKAKEAAQAMIDSGADVVMGAAGHSNTGTIKACEEADVYSFGEDKQYELAPDTVLTCTTADFGALLGLSVKQVLEGTFVGGYQEFGYADGVLGWSGWGNFADKLPEDVLGIYDRMVQEIMDGTLDVPKIEQITPEN